MAWVFLAGSLVFKLKKPVRYPFLNFSTIELRRLTCLEEVRLNRRLAPDIYLDIVPLALNESGGFHLGGGGEVIDWLVKMRRLPIGRSLEELIGRDMADQDLEPLAARLVRFYREAPSEPIAPEAFWLQLTRECKANSLIVRDDRFLVDHRKVDLALGLFEEAIKRHRNEIEARAAGGHVVEGHGDLRPEHVFLTTPPVVIDCLEFNRCLRLVDPFDEVSYLALECERLGGRSVGEYLLSRLADELEPPLDSVLSIYRASRALVRARLSLAHLLEPNPRSPEKWEPRAREYVDIALNTLSQLEAINTRGLSPP
jgi:aminoglycoside phosphotransferase family enzyme